MLFFFINSILCIYYNNLSGCRWSKVTFTSEFKIQRIILFIDLHICQRMDVTCASLLLIYYILTETIFLSLNKKIRQILCNHGLLLGSFCVTFIHN